MHTATLPNHHPDTRNKVVVPPVVSKTVRQILHNPVNTTTEMSHGVRCDGVWARGKRTKRLRPNSEQQLESEFSAPMLFVPLRRGANRVVDGTFAWAFASS